MLESIVGISLAITMFIALFVLLYLTRGGKR